MKTFLKFLLICALVASTTPTFAQYRGEPTFHDSYADLYLMGGYQHLTHSSKTYHVATFQMEILYSFIGSRIGISFGEDYLSYSPFGVLMFMPAILKSSLSDIDNKLALTTILLTAMSAFQFHIPLSSHLEISAGWDALKITKLKNYSNATYATGSLNAGLTWFWGDNFFVNGYYEYNHQHNIAIGLINWMFDGTVFSSQPDFLNGHSFGARIGWMF